MKKINSSAITGTTKAPFLKKTFIHFNSAMAESIDGLIKGLIDYTTDDVIILWGCEITASIPGTSSVTAGAIYYNGEVYQVDADASITTSGGQTLVWNIETIYDQDNLPADPVQYSDLSDHNQHQIDKFMLSGGASGSGIADYDDSTVKTLYDLHSEYFLIDHSGEQTPTLQPFWTSFSSASFSDIKYERIGKVVYITGAVQFSTGGTAPIFQLPVGYRPKYIIQQPVYWVIAPSTDSERICSIGTDGVVSAKSAPANGDILNFNLSFVIA